MNCSRLSPLGLFNAISKLGFNIEFDELDMFVSCSFSLSLLIYVVFSIFTYPVTSEEDILYQSFCIDIIFNSFPFTKVATFCVFSFGSVITSALSEVT